MGRRSGAATWRKSTAVIASEVLRSLMQEFSKLVKIHWIIFVVNYIFDCYAGISTVGKRRLHVRACRNQNFMVTWFTNLRRNL